MQQTYFIPFVCSVVLHSAVLIYGGDARDRNLINLPHSDSALEISIQGMQTEENQTKDDIKEDLRENEEVYHASEKVSAIEPVEDVFYEQGFVSNKVHVRDSELSVEKVQEDLHENNIESSCAGNSGITHIANPGVTTGVSEPDLFYNITPHYPRQSRRRDEEGLVILDVSILETGHVDEILISVSSGYPLLDKSAVDAVLQWQFHPAMQNGRPVSVRRTIPIVFKLK